MSDNEEVTPRQLVIIRQLCENSRADIASDETLDIANDKTFEQDIEQLIQQGLVEKNQSQIFLSTKGLHLLAESELMPDRNESRAEEIIKMYGKILKLEKVLADIEKLNNRSDIDAEEKFKQTLGLIRNYRIVPTF